MGDLIEYSFAVIEMCGGSGLPCDAPIIKFEFQSRYTDQFHILWIPDIFMTGLGNNINTFDRIVCLIS